MKPLEEMGKYATVVIDPPWPMTGFRLVGNTGLIPGRNLPYEDMDIPAIAAMPIQDVLQDDAFVFCWTVNRFLESTFALLRDWGLKYAFTMTWVKSGGIQTPVSPCFNAEWVVVGRQGKARFLDIKAFSTANYWPRGAHSEKPEGFYDLLRRVTPGPRLDIFGRRRIAGFESWGDEAPEGPALPDHYQTVFA